MNGFSNLDETFTFYGEYSLVSTDDFIRFWSSGVAKGEGQMPPGAAGEGAQNSLTKILAVQR